jgi:excisionase family DNA binding protein
MMRTMETNHTETTAHVMDLDDKVALKPRRVARMLEMSPSAIYEAINSGKLPSIRIGRSVRIPASAIRQLLDQAASH